MTQGISVRGASGGLKVNIDPLLYILCQRKIVWNAFMSEQFAFKILSFLARNVNININKKSTSAVKKERTQIL